MRILIAQDALHAAGGVESYLAHVVPALAARGHSLALLYTDRRSAAPLVGSIDGPTVDAGTGALDDAIRQLRGWAPDLCFSHNMAPLDVERRLLDEWPVVKFMHGYFGTCISALKSHAFPRRVACGRTLGPACLALYGPRHCGPLRPSAAIGSYRWATAQHRLLPRYAAVVVASRHMADEFRRHGVTGEQLKLVPLFPTAGSTLPRLAGPDTVLFLGRMTALKGGDILVEAVRRLAATGRRVRLVMAGDGPQRDDWQRLADRAAIDAVFPGWLDPAARTEAIGAASVLAIPSTWPEPFGLVGLEAAAMGVPSVGFDVGGIPQWLRHRLSGLLVPPSGGAAAFASALGEVLANAPLRERLSAGARQVAAEMSIDAHASALDRILREAAGLHPPAGVTA